MAGIPTTSQAAALGAAGVNPMQMDSYLKTRKEIIDTISDAEWQIAIDLYLVSKGYKLPTNREEFIEAVLTIKNNLPSEYVDALKSVLERGRVLTSTALGGLCKETCSAGNRFRNTVRRAIRGPLRGPSRVPPPDIESLKRYLQENKGQLPPDKQSIVEGLLIKLGYTNYQDKTLWQKFRNDFIAASNVGGQPNKDQIKTEILKQAAKLSGGKRKTIKTRKTRK